MGNFSKTDLHIPNKEWGDDHRERENYSAIERWARGLNFSGVVTGVAATGYNGGAAVTTAPTATLTHCNATTVTFNTGSDVTYNGSSIFTIHTTGLYLISGRADWSSSSGAGTNRALETIISGANFSPQDIRAPSSAFDVTNQFSTPFELSSGATVNFEVTQDSGGNLATIVEILSVLKMG